MDVYRSQHRPTPAVRTHSLRTSKGPVEFLESGDGPPILYFHGTGAGADLVFPFESRLHADGFRLMVMNRPGYYGTPLSSGRSAIECADLAAALLDSLGIDRAPVIGTSGGGIPAGTFASRYPDRTTGLILQCAQAHPWDHLRWLPAGSGWMLPFLRRPLLRQVAMSAHFLEVRCQRWFRSALLKGMCGPWVDALRDDPTTSELVRLLIDSSIACLAQPAGVRNDTDLLFGDAWVQPGSIRRPTLVIHDRSDPRAPVAHADWAVHCIPHAQVCELTGCGHLIWVGRDAQRMHESASHSSADALRRVLCRRPPWSGRSAEMDAERRRVRSTRSHSSFSSLLCVRLSVSASLRLPLQHPASKKRCRSPCGGSSFTAPLPPAGSG